MRRCCTIVEAIMTIAARVGDNSFHHHPMMVCAWTPLSWVVHLFLSQLSLLTVWFAARAGDNSFHHHPMMVCASWVVHFFLSQLSLSTVWFAARAGNHSVHHRRRSWVHNYNLYEVSLQPVVLCHDVPAAVFVSLSAPR